MIPPRHQRLIYAHREDGPEHEAYASWLRALVEGPEPYALSSHTLAGFLRIVTNRRIFDPPTPMDLALGFCVRLMERPRAVLLQPGPDHWRLLQATIEASGISGALVSDAYLAALALEHGAELVTTDADFSSLSEAALETPVGLTTRYSSRIVPQLAIF